jgi:two-component system chemotaxis response regulator CheY
MREMKFDVVEAGNGREALQKCEEHTDFAIALVDWNMPVMNGLDFVRTLRARHEFDNMKLMMVTTENDVLRISEALSAGANEFMMKPFTYDALEQKIALVVEEPNV